MTGSDEASLVCASTATAESNNSKNKRNASCRPTAFLTAWSAPGVGAPCVVCDRPVEKAEMELEIQYARDGGAPHFDVFHVHTRCYAAWEFVRRGDVGSRE